MGSDVLVVSLCAQWCGVCRDWRTVFADVAARHPSAGFRWLDVEDEADVVGDLDVETFPSILVARAGRVVFLGPILPQGGVLQRLLTSLGPDSPSLPDASGLLSRLQASAPGDFIAQIMPSE